MNSDIEDKIMDPVMQCITLRSHSSLSQQKLISFVTEIHTTSINFLTPKHPSDTQVFTLKMEILLEPTSNKLLIIRFEPETLSRRFFESTGSQDSYKDGDGDASFQDPSSFLAFLELLLDFPGLRWLWRGVVTMRTRRQTLQPGGWVVAGGIILLDILFNAFAQVVLGRVPSSPYLHYNLISGLGSLIFDGAFGGDGEEDFVMGEGVVVPSSSVDMSTKSCLGGMMVSLIFLEGLEEEAWVESMEVEEK
ncbi:hypothetical protein Tco_0605610 [Tanacetum coccineum]